MNENEQSQPSTALTIEPARAEPLALAVVNPLDMPVEVFRAGLDRRKANRGALLDWIRAAMVEGTDYGSIPTKRGPSKPSLWKPGAEKICGMLGVTPTFPTLREFEAAALKGTVVKSIVMRCEILNASGAVIAEGIGARNLEQDYGDLNKALKMAEKSAHIDATLRMAGLSEIFTQDLEDKPQGETTGPPDHRTTGKATETSRKPSEPPKPAPPVKTPPAATTEPKKGNADELRVWLKGCTDKFLAMAKGETTWAWWAYAVESGWILPTERLEAARPEDVFKIDWSKSTAQNTPNVRDQYTHHIAAISKLYDGTSKREECAITADEYKAKFAAVYADASRSDAPDAPDAPDASISCPHCSSTATHANDDYELINVCEKCGWQWDDKTGKPWEEHKWASIICPIPAKGQTKRDYAASPLTLGQIMRTDSKRFYGLVMNNQEAKPMVGKDGRTYQPSAADVRFSEACKAAVEHMNARMRTHHDNQAG